MLTSDEIKTIERQLEKVRPLRSYRPVLVGSGFVSGMFLIYGLVHQASQYVAIAGIFLVASSSIYVVAATANRYKEMIERLLEERAELGLAPGTADSKGESRNESS
jgi:hypothetical protein